MKTWNYLLICKANIYWSTIRLVKWYYSAFKCHQKIFWMWCMMIVSEILAHQVNNYLFLCGRGGVGWGGDGRGIIPNCRFFKKKTCLIHVLEGEMKCPPMSFLDSMRFRTCILGWKRMETGICGYWQTSINSTIFKSYYENHFSLCFMQPSSFSAKIFY